MSIAAAYLVSEGIVLGTDSSTTVQLTTPQGRGVVQLLTHSQKIFEIGEKSRFGICTWGAASLGEVSHRRVVAQVSDRIDDNTTVENVADFFIETAMPFVAKSKVDFVGYYLGGWNPGTHEPVCMHIELRQNEQKKMPLPLGLCSFSGNPKFFARVFRGFDPQLQANLLHELKNALKGHLPQDYNFDALFNESFQKVAAPLVTAGFKDLPIREAIDFVYSYLHVTIKAEKFKFGPPICGGPIEIAFITSDRHFRWARHKPFHSAMLEQEGEYDF